MADIKKIKIGNTEYNVKDVVSGYITNSALSGYATENFVTSQGYITGITSSDVTTALGFTPYSAANPNNYTSVIESTVSGWGFTKNTGTVTSVNNTSPDSNGDVTIALPTSGVGLRTVSNAFDIMQDDDPSTAYSIVGTLTTDVDNKYKYSGFSADNYIQSTSTYTLGASDNIEIVFKGATSYTPSSGDIYAFDVLGVRLKKTSEGKLFLWAHKTFQGSSTGNKNYPLGNTNLNNTPYIKLTRTCTSTRTVNKTYSSSNGIDWTELATYDYNVVTYRADITSSITLGKSGDAYWQDGWIDLTGCYVKINDVTVFDPDSWDNIKQAAKATTSLYGLVKPDGTTISVNNGVISAVNNGTVTDVLVDTISVVNNGVASIGFGNLIKTTSSSAQKIQLSSGSDDTVLKLQSRASSSYLSLYGGFDWLGSIGVNSNHKPVFYNGTYYTLATTDDIPTSISDLTDDTATTPIAKADTLTGLTASVAELNILDGVTATASEINVLDGITASTTELNYVDGVTSAIQTQIDGKANTSLSNLDSTGQKVLDGQWVKHWLTIADGVSLPTSDDTTYSLSSYLPDNTYNYEVQFIASCFTANTSGSVARVQLTSDISDEIYVCGTTCRATSSFSTMGNAIIPVGTGRTITVTHLSTFTGGIYYLIAKGYRRIGTNS